LGSMAIGAQHLSGSSSRVGSAIWIDAAGECRPAGHALRQGGDDTADERNTAMRGGERCLSLRCPYAGGLRPTNPGHHHHIYGVTRSGCGSIRQLSIGAPGLGDGLTSMRADIRFWTAIALVGICGFSVVRGWSI